MDQAVIRRRRNGGFNPSRLFNASEPGQLMPVDPAYLYQDTAGTQPVTATGQSVALQLDQSKGLVLGTELVTNGDFSAGSDGWTENYDGISGWQVVAGVAVHVGATNPYFTSSYQTTVGATYKITCTVTGVVKLETADGIVDLSTGSRFFRASLTFLRLYSNSSGSIDNISIKELPGNHDTQATVGSRPIYGKHPANGYRNMLAASDTLSTQSVTVTAVAHTLAFTGTGTVTLSGASTSGPLVGTGASNRVSLTFTPTAGTLTLTVSGSVTLAQMERGSLTAYQRCGATSGLSWPAPASYDITEVGQPDLHYLHYNGVSSFMVSPTITPATDKVQVFAGIRKLSDASIAVALELSAAYGTNAGTFYLAAPESTGLSGDFSFASRGSATPVAAKSPTTLAPASRVVAGIGSISTDTSILRVNGAQVASTVTDQGTGNYLAYPIYTGRRGGTTMPANILLYSKIIRFGATLTAAQIASTERWTAQRTGVAI